MNSKVVALDSEAYRSRFDAAVRKSEKFGCVSSSDFEELSGHNVTLADYLGAIDEFIDSSNESNSVRTRCAGVHFRLWTFLRSRGMPSILTIGDVSFSDGAPAFAVSYARLKQELRGINQGNMEAFNGHVWLTLPNEETIIDVTALPYFAGSGFSVSSWKDCVYISEYINFREPVLHVPFLVGVDFLIRSGAVFIKDEALVML